MEFGGYLILNDPEILPDGVPTELFTYAQKTNFTASPATDVLTCAINHDAALDESVKFFTDGVLPAPLIPNHAYRILSAGLTLTQIKITDDPIPSTTPVDITDTGTGTHVLWTRPLELVSAATVNTGTDIITTSSRHFFYSDPSLSDRVRFTTTGTMPAPLVAGVDYWVVYNPTTFGFKVSLTGGGGTPVDITTTGSGVLNVFAVRGDTCADFHAGQLGVYGLEAGFMLTSVSDVIAGGGGGGGAVGGQGDPIVVELPRPTIKVRDPELASLMRRARKAASTMENLTIVGASGNSEDGFSL